MKSLIAVLLLLPLSSCSTSEKSNATEPVSSKDKSDGDDSSRSRDPEASANLVTLTNSLSSSPLLSHSVSSSKVEDLVAKFEGAKGRVQLESKVAAERLARKGLSQVLATAKKIASVEMEKSAGNTAPESTQLELALAALSAKNFAFAEYYLQSLSESKNAKIKAAAYNAIGVVALKDERVPEAVLYFKQALKAIPNYKPALLNLGFAALKGGDLDTARKTLSDMQGDWFVQYGLISVARLEGNDSRAQDLCEKVVSKEPQHKAALYNCALFELQNKKNFTKARDLAGKAASAKYGELGWDEKAMQLTNMIDFEEAAVKRAQAQKKAAEKAAEKADEKPGEKVGYKAEPKGPPKPAGEGPKADKEESAPSKPAAAPKK